MLNREAREPLGWMVRPAVLGMLAAMGVAGPAMAQAEPSYEELRQENERLQSMLDESGFDSPNAGKIGLSAGVDFTNEYFFRGIYQGAGNDEGVIVQPYADISFEVNEDLSLYLGTWNSLRTATDAVGSPTDDVWYEADVYGGVSLGLPANFGLDVSYITLYNPAGGDTFSDEVNVAVSYDDSELLGDWALSPYALVGIEVDGGSDAGTSEGTYLELGFGPSFTLIDSADYPVTMSVPVTFGFSLDDYYEFDDPSVAGFNPRDEAFGYADVGVDFSMPLAFMPSEYGQWSISAGVHGLFLGETTELADENQDDFHVLGTFGISFTY